MKSFNDDPFWPWNIHIEIRRKEISKEDKKIIEDILRGDNAQMKLSLESQQVLDIIDGNVSEDMLTNSEYVLVDSNYAGEWRWGVTYEVVIKDKQGNLWGTTYNQQTGDNYYNSLEDGGTVHFYPMEAVTKTVTEYKRVRL